MPCFFKREKVQKLLETLKIVNLEKLYDRLLKEDYSDSLLHSMTEAQLIKLIMRVYVKNIDELTNSTIKSNPIQKVKI